MLYYVVLYYIISYYIILYCIFILYYIILCYVILYYIILYYILLYIIIYYYLSYIYIYVCMCGIFCITHVMTYGLYIDENRTDPIRGLGPIGYGASRFRACRWWTWRVGSMPWRSLSVHGFPWLEILGKMGGKNSGLVIRTVCELEAMAQSK